MTAVALHHQTLGAGPPLVILHGLFGSGENWRTFAKSMAEQYQVWLLDLRNHGLSPHAPGMNYRELAEDVRTFLDAHTLDAPTVLGHSMGGKTAMALALQHPERVRRLLVADIAPVPYRHQSEHRKLIEAMQALPLASGITRSEADRLLAEAVPEWSIRAFLLKNLVSENGIWRWRLNLSALHAGLGDILEFPFSGLYSRPTLFIGGARSHYILPEYHGAIHERFTQNRMVLLKEAGHWLHAEQPDAFRETVQAFLQRTEHDA